MMLLGRNVTSCLIASYPYDWPVWLPLTSYTLATWMQHSKNADNSVSQCQDPQSKPVSVSIAQVSSISVLLIVSK